MFSHISRTSPSWFPLINTTFVSAKSSRISLFSAMRSSALNCQPSKKSPFTTWRSSPTWFSWNQINFLAFSSSKSADKWGWDKAVSRIYSRYRSLFARLLSGLQAKLCFGKSSGSNQRSYGKVSGDSKGFRPGKCLLVWIHRPPRKGHKYRRKNWRKIFIKRWQACRLLCFSCGLSDPSKGMFCLRLKSGMQD